MYSLVSLEERLKQNAKVHSVKGDRGEGRRGEGKVEKGGKGKRRGKRERAEGRECRQTEANEKKLTSFSCRGKNI